MTARLLDGKALAEAMQAELVAEVGEFVRATGVRPGLAADATVTVCHSRTADVGALTRLADVVVMAIGRAGYLKADMVRPGAVVVDVGMNRVGQAWAGDVDFAAVQGVAW